ncbi:MAG TPA: 6-phosphogluconolactonase [Mycobacteriales bacterium]|nr:6-phosphogluconolactonase [Mycobacteriales bacterium]
MPAPIQVYASPARLGAALAERIADEIEAAPGGRYLLGCPGGRSAQQTYIALATEVGRRALDLSGLHIVMMDEYLGPDRQPIDAAAAHSCRRFGREQILAPLNAAARAGVAEDRLWLPDPSDPGAYDRRIADAGGIDLFILASGASDGHVAFNPPGTERTARTRVVPLAETTRRDNLATFPTLGELKNVPTHGITVGPQTIAELSAGAVLIAHGPDKAVTAARLATTSEYVPDWPATIVHECRNPLLLLDAAAAGRIEST